MAPAAGTALKWRPTTFLLALLASIVPLGSVIFVIWTDQTGRSRVQDEPTADAEPAAAAPTRT
jgi:hypothetical protein